MALTHCECCNKLLKDCTCKTSPADYIEAQPDDVIIKIIKTIQRWGKK